MPEKYDFSLTLFRPTIYKFLRIAKWKKPEKGIVLDCGAGGQNPPLALFCKHGYDAYGIDISDNALEEAENFAAIYDLDLKLSIGDMRELSFDREYFDLVYLYNSSIHLTKADTKKAVKEMLRVLKKGGLFCINFLWYNDVHPSLGKEKEMGEFWNMEHGEETVHSFFTEEETEQMLEGTKVLFKEKTQYDVLVREEYFSESSFEYIVEK
ncbi:MAG: class I SAM-dependent methyltransferase [Candidatus Heimdallarchaeaceae archaeon]